MVTLKTPDLDLSAIRDAIRSIDVHDLDTARLARLRDELARLDLPHVELPHIDISALERSGIDLRERAMPKVDLSRAASALLERVMARRRPPPPPPRRGPSRGIVFTALAMAASAAAGAILAFMFDPEHGARRREALRRRASRLRGAVAIPIDVGRREPTPEEPTPEEPLAESIMSEASAVAVGSDDGATPDMGSNGVGDADALAETQHTMMGDAEERPAEASAEA
jgi:hypothetical protein